MLKTCANYSGGPVSLATLRRRSDPVLRALVPGSASQLSACGQADPGTWAGDPHSCVFRWVQVYSPEIDRLCRPYLRLTNKSYRGDETLFRSARRRNICTEPWTPPVRRSIFCSPPSASFVKYFVLPVILRRASSMGTRMWRIRLRSENSRWKERCQNARDCGSAAT